jgi:putative two-component system response regulator
MTVLRKTILAVDDTPSSLEIIHGALCDEFFVFLSKSARMAMSTLDNTKVDLILLDIEMPEISGFDFMDILKTKPKIRDIPVIFVTSHATPEFVVEAVGKGAIDYIVKPFSPDILIDKVFNAFKMQRF